MCEHVVFDVEIPVQMLNQRLNLIKISREMQKEIKHVNALVD